MYQQPCGVFSLDLPMLTASGRAVLPTDLNSFNQLSQLHHVPNSELADYKDRRFSARMQMVRNSDGLGSSVRMGMERFMARQTGRLPFLTSSNSMEEVLTGRYEEIDFEDFLKQPEEQERLRQPHSVVEEALGLKLY